METSSVWTATIWSKEVFGTNERKDFSIHWWLSCSQPDGVYAVYPLAGTFTLLKMYSSLAAKARVLPSRSSSSHWACLVWVTLRVWFTSYFIEVRELPFAQPKSSCCGFPLSKKKKQKRKRYIASWSSSEGWNSYSSYCFVDLWEPWN